MFQFWTDDTRESVVFSFHLVWLFYEAVQGDKPPFPSARDHLPAVLIARASELSQSEHRHIRDVYEQLHEQLPDLRKGGGVLFLQDPFPRREWNSLFLVGLCFRDPHVRVYRLDRLLRDWGQSASVDVDVVFTYENARLTLCEAEPFHGVAVRDLPHRACQQAALGAPAALVRGFASGGEAR